MHDQNNIFNCDVRLCGSTVREFCESDRERYSPPSMRDCMYPKSYNRESKIKAHHDIMFIGEVKFGLVVSIPSLHISQSIIMKGGLV